MNVKDFVASDFFRYTLKFLSAFCILYFSTSAIIAFTSPGGYYSDFVHNYLDYPTLLRASLLNASKILLSIFGYSSRVVGLYHLQLENGSSVQLVYSCLGYGLMSFWAAFVFANKGSAKKKIAWLLTGFLFLWMINVTRIALLLAAIDKH